MIGDFGALFDVAGEAVEVVADLLVLIATVKALEEASVEEGDFSEVSESFLGSSGEERFVAVKIVEVVGGTVFLEAFVEGELAIGLRSLFLRLAHALVEGGEEEIL